MSRPYSSHHRPWKLRRRGQRQCGRSVLPGRRIVRGAESSARNIRHSHDGGALGLTGARLEKPAPRSPRSMHGEYAIRVSPSTTADDGFRRSPPGTGIPSTELLKRRRQIPECWMPDWFDRMVTPTGFSCQKRSHHLHRAFTGVGKPPAWKSIGIQPIWANSQLRGSGPVGGDCCDATILEPRFLVI